MYRPFINQQGRTRKRDTCIRVTVTVILLGIVFGFIIYEWNGYWPGIEEHLDLTDHQGTNKSHKISEDEDHKHHHEHHQDDSDHNDHDHDHKDEDDHDDHDSHTHKHSQSLYHNAAIITDSGKTPSIYNYNANKYVHCGRKSIHIFNVSCVTYSNLFQYW